MDNSTEVLVRSIFKDWSEGWDAAVEAVCDYLYNIAAPVDLTDLREKMK